jgi:hypothetical protein
LRNAKKSGNYRAFCQKNHPVALYRVNKLSAKGCAQAVGMDEQIQRVFNGRDHNVTMTDQRAAAPFPSHDADGKVLYYIHSAVSMLHLLLMFLP